MVFSKHRLFFAIRASFALPVLALLWTPAAAQSNGADGAACATGTISAIDVDSRSVFEPEATGFAPLRWTYRALNLLHVRTTPSFIRGELLVEEGDCYDSFLVSESARLLDRYSFLSQATITEEDDGRGGRKLLVTTRDEWSTQIDVGVTYDAGLNLERLQVTEENFLGRGVYAEFTHQDRREVNIQSFALSTPRFFGRADAQIALGRTRAGDFFGQSVRYPFVGEAGRVSIREGYDRRSDLFAYATDGSQPFSQVLVPIRRERFELSTGRRLGEPGRSVILGVSLTRDFVEIPRPPEVTLEGDFDNGTVLEDVPPAMALQLSGRSATRVSLHLGTRRFRYREYIGLDGVRDRQTVGIGLFAGVSLGRSIGLLTPGRTGAPSVDDVFTRAHASFTAAVGSSLLQMGSTAEARRFEGAWRDVLADADVVLFGRTERLPSHTLFFRASTAAGWDATLPFQLSLGGREGVRSLVEDRYPGGRMLRFVLEDRIVSPWPKPNDADLGFTLLADLGRVWPGDVPYGTDSGWQAGVGFGLRIGLPAGTRNVWRTDIVFPVGGAGGSPIFRVTFELNKLRSGFFTNDLMRSRRFTLGPEHF